MDSNNFEVKDTKAIETRNLTKIYQGDIRAVDDVTLLVKQGEIFGLLGPNGAGKTTMIKMIVTLASITSGRLEGFWNRWFQVSRNC